MRTLTLYYDLARDIVSLTKAANAPEVTEIKGKLGDRFTLALHTHRAGTSELLPTGSVLVAAAKPEADYQGVAIVLVESDDWTVPSDETGNYTAVVTLNTDELRALFTTSEDSENAHFEISHRPDLSTDPSSSQTIRFVIGQDVIKDNDSAPSETGDGWTTADARFVRQYPTFTGLTGGTATDLDSVAISSADANRLVMLVISNSLKVFQIVNGADAEDAANGIVRPDNFDATTNPYIYRQLL